MTSPLGPRFKWPFKWLREAWRVGLNAPLCLVRHLTLVTSPSGLRESCQRKCVVSARKIGSFCVKNGHFRGLILRFWPDMGNFGGLLRGRPFALLGVWTMAG